MEKVLNGCFAVAGKHYLYNWLIKFQPDGSFMFSVLSINWKRCVAKVKKYLFSFFRTSPRTCPTAQPSVSCRVGLFGQTLRESGSLLGGSFLVPRCCLGVVAVLIKAAITARAPASAPGS